MGGAIQDDDRPGIGCKHVAMLSLSILSLLVAAPISLTVSQMVSCSQLVGSLPENSANRAAFIQSQVIAKYNRMLHPPLTYLGDAFQYRQSDGKLNVSPPIRQMEYWL